MKRNQCAKSSPKSSHRLSSGNPRVGKVNGSPKAKAKVRKGRKETAKNGSPKAEPTCLPNLRAASQKSKERGFVLVIIADRVATSRSKMENAKGACTYVQSRIVAEITHNTNASVEREAVTLLEHPAVS